MGNILVFGIVLFGLALVAQVCIWRFFIIRKEILTLGIIYFLIPILGTLALSIPAKLFQSLDSLLILLLHLSLSCAYIQTYPALKENIPSFKILLIIDAMTEQGSSRDDLIQKLSASGLIARKINELDGDGLVTRGDDGNLTLLPTGRILAYIFKTYRRVLGLNRGLG